MAKQDICVWGEEFDSTVRLIGAAREITAHSAGRVFALVIGQRDQADAVAASGADGVLLIETQDEGLPERYASTVAKALDNKNITAFLCDSTVRGKALAASIAAMNGISLIRDIKSFSYDEGSSSPVFVQPILDGNAVRKIAPVGEFWVATIDAGSFEQPSSSLSSGDIAVIESDQPYAVTVTGMTRREDSATLLSSAQRVLCVGAGMGRGDGLDAARSLAHALGAEIGCTRGYLECDRSLGYDSQVGISGHKVKPKIYIGLGISGQVQHTIGMSDAQIVVVANKDEDAPFFRMADYGYIGDAREFAEALAKELSGCQ